MISDKAITRCGERQRANKDGGWRKLSQLRGFLPKQYLFDFYDNGDKTSNVCHPGIGAGLLAV